MTSKTALNLWAEYKALLKMQNIQLIRLLRVQVILANLNFLYN